MANGRRDAAKEAYWREMVSRQASSGFSVREFCQRENLSESSLHAWRRTIADRDNQLGRARRKFYDAQDSDAARSTQMLAMVGQLYQIERESKELSDALRLAVRQERRETPGRDSRDTHPR